MNHRGYTFTLRSYYLRPIGGWWEAVILAPDGRVALQGGFEDPAEATDWGRERVEGLNARLDRPVTAGKEDCRGD